MADMKSKSRKLIPLKYSCEEVYERMENSLCIFCEEKDSPEHQKLKHKGIQIVCVEDEQMSDTEETSPPKAIENPSLASLDHSSDYDMSLQEVESTYKINLSQKEEMILVKKASGMESPVKRVDEWPQQLSNDMKNNDACQVFDKLSLNIQPHESGQSSLIIPRYPQIPLQPPDPPDFNFLQQEESDQMLDWISENEMGKISCIEAEISNKSENDGSFGGNKEEKKTSFKDDKGQKKKSTEAEKKRVKEQEEMESIYIHEEEDKTIYGELDILDDEKSKDDDIDFESLVDSKDNDEATKDCEEDQTKQQLSRILYHEAKLVEYHKAEGKVFIWNPLYLKMRQYDNDSINKAEEAVKLEHVSMEEKPIVPELVCERSKLLRWLLAKTKMKEFERIKQYASEILAILLQNNTTKKQLGQMNGVDIVLEGVVMYKSKDPKNLDEEEMLENLFDGIRCLLRPLENKWEVLKPFGEIQRQTKDKIMRVRYNVLVNLLQCQMAGKIIEIFWVLYEAKAKRRLRIKKTFKVGDESLTVNSEANAKIEQADAVSSHIDPDVFMLLQVIGVGRKISSFSFCLTAPKESLETLLLTLNKSSDNEKAVDIDHQGHQSNMRSVALSEDNTLVMSTSHSEVKLWNSIGSCLRTIESRYGLCNLIVPQNKYGIVGTKSMELEITDIENATKVKEVKAHGGTIWSIAPIPNDNGLVTVSADHEVKFWEYQVKQKPSQTINQLTVSNVNSMKMNVDVLVVPISPDAKHIAVAMFDSTVIEENDIDLDEDLMEVSLWQEEKFIAPRYRDFIKNMITGTFQVASVVFIIDLSFSTQHTQAYEVFHFQRPPED